MLSGTRVAASAALVFLSASVAAQSTTPAPPTTSAAAPSITAVSDCHTHSTVQYCVAGTAEYEIVGPTATEEFEAQYTDCHSHGSSTYCVNSAGEDVQIVVEGAERTESEGEHAHEHGGETEEGDANEGVHCHEHAGIPHCTGGSESEAAPTCQRIDREYNKPLRLGLLFVILVTSGLGAFAPIIMTRFTRMSQRSLIFVAAKQFGTGVIISTAFVHLFTHADLMFSNECIGELPYEATTASIFMGGLFLSFLVDYISKRFLLWRQSKRGGEQDTEATAAPTADAKTASPANSAVIPAHGHSEHVDLHGDADAKINVLVLEAGIIFHSLLIGITLVVSGDAFFITLFVVILFHQMFEGLALGTCIAGIPPQAASTLVKFLMAGGFTLVTPIGMAIGIGVLDRFNGSDPSTLIAIGTLNALSAGILAWVGIHEMLARDWLHGGLVTAGMLRTGVAMFFLIAGMVAMSVLGKWA
ncbi:hypothetical protein DPSP01_005252 [Paraphaeosphaeria sporulosa]